MKPKIQSTSWNPEIEKAILKKWEEHEDIYHFAIHDDESKPPFVIDTPPPYPSGRPWHIGAAAHYAQIDMIARTARMNGKNVLFPIGIDRNGLPVEIYTEKKYKVRMRQMDRQKFLDLCKVALDDLEAEMIQIMKSMGLSGNFKEYYRTDSDEYRALTQATFIELWKRGLVYLANRPNNYCSDCGTTIADAEIIYDEIPTKLIYMKFKIKEKAKEKKEKKKTSGDDDGDDDTFIIIASTRPELLFACQAVIVNPEDDRYKHLQGSHAILPLFNREVSIIPHHSAKPEFGSGAVMVCSYGDQNDVQLFRELGLKEIVALNENGFTTEAAGQRYAGLRVNQARAKVIEDLKNAGVMEKEESITHRTPLCERSKTPIEIIPLHDYYVKQLEFVPQLKQLAFKLKFYPDMHRQILLKWLDSINIDWPVSRRRFYGTEIPIWYCNACKAPNLAPADGKYYRPWKDKPPFEKCEKCGASSVAEFTGEDRTFDTWMDSSISPLYVTKFGKDKKMFNYAYPTAMRPQAKDIIRTWLHYTMLRCVQLTGKMPWHEAWIMGYGVDEKGEKMSKSRGNVIDPFPIIQKYGADTFRFWSASEANLGYDFRCSEQRIAGAQKFLSKLWNVGRFLSSFEVIEERPSQQLEASDRWILAELARLVEECRRGYSEYNFFVPANAIRDFTWNLFAAHYIEMVKGRAYVTKNKNNNNNDAGKRSALYTLHRCFSTILLLIAPVTPFIAEELWTKMYSIETTIHRQSMFRQEKDNEKEEEEDDVEMAKYTKQITDFNSRVWNKKKETISKETGKPLSLKDPIDIPVPDELAQFGQDLKEMHNLLTAK
jgi:valyl-tRNA synthetase